MWVGQCVQLCSQYLECNHVDTICLPCFKSGFFNFGTTDISGHIILCCVGRQGDVPAHRGTFPIIPGVYQLDASSTFSPGFSEPKMSADIARSIALNEGVPTTYDISDYRVLCIPVYGEA